MGGRGSRGGVTAALLLMLGYLRILWFFLHKTSVDLFCPDVEQNKLQNKILGFWPTLRVPPVSKSFCGVTYFQRLLLPGTGCFCSPWAMQAAEPGSTFVSQQPQSVVRFPSHPLSWCSFGSCWCWLCQRPEEHQAEGEGSVMMDNQNPNLQVPGCLYPYFIF